MCLIMLPGKKSDRCLPTAIRSKGHETRVERPDDETRLYTHIHVDLWSE